MALMNAPIPAASLAVAVLLLAGCGGSPWPTGKQADSYVGWYCVDNAKTGIKDCEKRLMRNGRPINSVVYERLGAPEGQQTETRDPNIHPGYDQSPVTVINSLDDSGGLSVENQGPPPRQAKDYVDRSGSKNTGAVKNSEEL
jgi:hypothetical protein